MLWWWSLVSEMVCPSEYSRLSSLSMKCWKVCSYYDEQGSRQQGIRPITFREFWNFRCKHQASTPSAVCRKIERTRANWWALSEICSQCKKKCSLKLLYRVGFDEPQWLKPFYGEKMFPCGTVYTSANYPCQIFWCKLDRNRHGDMLQMLQMHRGIYVFHCMLSSAYILYIGYKLKPPT